MPLYEEKLISPLAIRFTQEHIRSTFRDNREVEASRAEIEVRPGSGDYDIVLHAPFPHIEIIRWAPKGRGFDGEQARDEDEVEYHWFSFDNRRLYCLQNAAAEHWPKRVACIVEVVYADPDGSMYRKYDSKTCGLSVSMRHSSTQAPFGKWDWRRAVLANLAAGGDLQAITAATMVIAEDDGKESVDELSDAERAQSSLAALIEQSLREAAAKQSAPSVAKGPPAELEVSSTVASSDEEDEEREKSGSATPSSQEESEASKRTTPKAPAVVQSMKESMWGSWIGPKKETYYIDTTAESKWSVVRRGADGSTKNFSLQYDWNFDCVWWGTGGRFYAYAPELVGDTETLKWYSGDDYEMKKPMWTWQKAEKSSQQSSRKAGWAKGTATYAKATGKQSKWVMRGSSDY